MQEITLNEKAPLTKVLPKKVINVEMFRAGEQTDSDGDKALFTEKDLEDIISTYDPKTHEAPLIVGHDQTDSTPSLGWVRRMWRNGKSLWGKIELTPKAEKLISEGIFKKVSSSFYAPEADANPYPGKLSLRHLALVNIPAVKGLAEFRECVSDTITVDFSEQRSKALFKELLDKKISIMVKPRKKRISNHAEGPMHVTINVGGSSKAEDLPLYDDGGNQLSKNGTPVDYYEDDDEMMDGASDFPEDFPEEDEDLMYEEDPELEGEGEGEGEGEEMPPEDSDMEDPGMDEGGEEMPPEEGEMEGEGEEMPPEDPGMEGEESGADESLEEDPTGSDDIEDISEDLDDEDSKISELASSYSALELAKALLLQKQTNDMVESEGTQNYSECEDKKDDEKEEKDYEEMSGDSAPENFSEDEDEDKDEKEEKSEDFKEEESEDFKEEECETKEEKEFEEEKEECCDEDKSEDFKEEDSEESAESLKDRVARLEKQLAEQKKLAREKEISDFCESVYRGGKLTEQIVQKQDLVKFMASLNGKNSMNFSEGTKKSQFDFFSDVLEKLPELVSFSEVASEATAPKPKKVASPANGYEYDKSNLDIHAKALEFSEAKGVDYVTALKTVIEEG